MFVTIQVEAGDETKFCLSDEEVQILESEVDRVNRTIAEIEAEEGREMCRGTLETELINAIREHVKRLKTTSTAATVKVHKTNNNTPLS